MTRVSLGFIKGGGGGGGGGGGSESGKICFDFVDRLFQKILMSY